MEAQREVQHKYLLTCGQLLKINHRPHGSQHLLHVFIIYPPARENLVGVNEYGAVLVKQGQERQVFPLVTAQKLLKHVASEAQSFKREADIYRHINSPGFKQILGTLHGNTVRTDCADSSHH